MDSQPSTTLNQETVVVVDALMDEFRNTGGAPHPAVFNKRVEDLLKKAKGQTTEHLGHDAHYQKPPWKQKTVDRLIKQQLERDETSEGLMEIDRVTWKKKKLQRIEEQLTKRNFRPRPRNENN